jgi:glycosyltransferase involved in cell wall biosynthesis
VHHVVVGERSHGVAGLALQLSAGRTRTTLPALRGPDDARAARRRLPDPGSAPHVHLHLTDALLGADPAATLTELVRGRRAAITLHDVPQPGEGAARFARRARDYAALAAAADAVVVCSRHEQAGLRALGASADAVLPLPIDGRLVPAAPGSEPTVGVLGWVHPGKGHAALADALAATGRPAILVALGGVAAGHEGLDDDLARHCAAVGVGFRCTGYLDDMSLLREAARIRVPVCPHRHVSASGSVGSWLSAGRRPIVVDGGYARELDARLPGALRLTDDLPRALAAAFDDAASTVLAAGVRVGPTTAGAAEAQAALLDRWARHGTPAA